MTPTVQDNTEGKTTVLLTQSLSICPDGLRRVDRSTSGPILCAATPVLGPRPRCPWPAAEGSRPPWTLSPTPDRDGVKGVLTLLPLVSGTGPPQRSQRTLFRPLADRHGDGGPNRAPAGPVTTTRADGRRTETRRTLLSPLLLLSWGHQIPSSSKVFAPGLFSSVVFFGVLSRGTGGLQGPHREVPIPCLSDGSPERRGVG